jgi:isoaspartyl peptidase/L-asparaginase-like protein (Ntn-hydrolase superfamily)
MLMTPSRLKTRAVFMKFLALHLGAGYHSPLREEDYKLLSAKAIEACFSLHPSTDNWSLETVTNAISFLELDPTTNCGIGSNLNRNGFVECDASMFFGGSYFGAVGAVPRTWLLMSRMLESHQDSLLAYLRPNASSQK